MKENNSPLENIKDEYKMILSRQRRTQNKWIKKFANKIAVEPSKEIKEE